ncbi:AEC family transporter [Lentibacillus sp. CBA3610]|uniref:AEC family transporter n=1 Tax=Lentibacillus sp. CBA3610 TaxID=2518176 RepID=UPI001595CE3E|nr:AEC family transporter [Lentibacillus sp. CBA3610]QKY70160.1 AEC family transporter [Lentibacillus sp. CBA3610]
MTELLTILIDILLPIFIIMGIGYFMQKKFELNLQTLAKLNIYFLVPGFIFVKLYETEFSLRVFSLVILFFLLYIFILFVLSKILIKLQGFDHAKGTTFSNSVIFFNSGNYGVPVNDLVFRGDPFAMSIQVIVLTMQNILTFTYGIFALQSVSVGKLKALLGYFKMPVLYAMAAGIILNISNISVPEFIWTPANYISDAMIAIALILLGAQVAQIKITSALTSVYFSLMLRLLVGPAIALAIIFVFGIDGVAAQALFIASAMPTSVNSSVIAQEYNNHPHFAAQIVLFSTLFSAATVTGVIYLARVLF